MNKAIVLLSGGMDSAVSLYLAKKEYDCCTLIFDYGQKAVKEINCAKEISKIAGCPDTLLKISMPWKGSSLLDLTKDVPEAANTQGDEIPDTYVPGRNIIFLSYAVSYAEATGANAVFIGAHQLDYSNYPDCRSGFFKTFQGMIDCGTKAGTKGNGVKIITPVIDKTKKEIIEIGNELGVPFELTWSCYKQGDLPCGTCESCTFRIAAFRDAGIDDLCK